MSKILIKNIHTLYQAGEDFPEMICGEAMKEVPVIKNAFLALEDGVIMAYGSMEDWEGITDWRGVEVARSRRRGVANRYDSSRAACVLEVIQRACACKTPGPVHVRRELRLRSQ